MDMIDIVSAWLASARHTAFEVIVAGRITGGLLDESLHTPVGFRFDNDTLRIDFARGERLAVSQPVSLSRTSTGGLRIEQGSEARFSWPADAPEGSPGARYAEIYSVTADGYAMLRKILIPPHVASYLDPNPTAGPLGGSGTPFVRIAPVEEL